MKEVTDPAILKQLNGASEMKEVTDPALLAQLNAPIAPTTSAIAPIAPGSSNTEPAQPSLLEDVGNVGKAVIGGAANAVVDTAQTVQDAVPFILSHIGAIDKTKAEHWYKENEDFNNQIRPQPEGEIGKAITANPVAQGAYALTRSLGNIASLGSGQGALASIAPVVKGTTTAGKIGAGLANMIPQALSGAIVGGAATPGTQEERDSSAVLGAAIPVGVSAIGGALKSGANSLTKGSKVTNTIDDQLNTLKSKIAPIQEGVPTNTQAATSTAKLWESVKATNDTNYDVIKQIPGKPRMGSAVTAINKTLDDVGSVMSSQQLNVLKDIKNQLKAAKTTEDILSVQQDISQQFKSFSGNEATPSVYKAYKKIQSEVRSALQSHAEANGAGGAIAQANEFNSKVVQPLEEFGGKDLAEAIAKGDTNAIGQTGRTMLDRSLKSPDEMKAFLKFTGNDGANLAEQHILTKSMGDITTNEKFNTQTALKNINKYINTFKTTLPDQSVARLQGVQKVLKELNDNKTLLKEISVSASAMRTGGQIAGASLGSLLGSAGGPMGTALGVAGGIVAGPKIVQALSALIKNPSSQQLLETIGKGAGSTKLISDLTKGLLLWSTTGERNDGR